MDVQVVQFYENFTGPVLMALCEMGFAEPNGIEEFVSGGRLVGPDAAFPFNTSVGNGRYQIVNRGTGTALDGAGNSTVGSTTVLWTPNSSTNNQWTITSV